MRSRYPRQTQKTLTSTDNIVVFYKPAGVTRAHPPLREECDHEKGNIRRVNPDTKPPDREAAKYVSVLVTNDNSGMQPLTYAMTGVYK
jgi:hypothetical protein